MLEPLAVRRAAARFTDRGRGAARRHLADYARARERSETGEARAAHAAFHFTLYARVGIRVARSG